jgi:hypothetical protein
VCPVWPVAGSVKVRVHHPEGEKAASPYSRISIINLPLQVETRHRIPNLPTVYHVAPPLPPFLSAGMYKNSAHSPEQDALQPIFLNTPSLFGSHSHIHPIWRDIPQHNTMNPSPQPSETDPLLPVDLPVKKPFYRPRPLWYAPLSKSRCASLNHCSFRSPPGLSHSR